VRRSRRLCRLLGGLALRLDDRQPTLPAVARMASGSVSADKRPTYLCFVFKYVRGALPLIFVSYEEVTSVDARRDE